MVKYFSVADVVVLPYRSSTQSGIIPIAYHFNKPVVTTNVGGLAECVKQAKTGFVCNPDPKGVSKGLLDFFNSNENFSKNVSEYKKQFTWEAYVNNIISVIK